MVRRALTLYRLISCRIIIRHETAFARVRCGFWSSKMWRGDHGKRRQWLNSSREISVDMTSLNIGNRCASITAAPAVLWTRREPTASLSLFRQRFRQNIYMTQNGVGFANIYYCSSLLLYYIDVIMCAYVSHALFSSATAPVACAGARYVTEMLS